MFGFKILRVTGHSMLPTLKSGQYVLIRKTSHAKPGEIIAFRFDDQLWIKRVKDVFDAGYEIMGDNHTDSYDSRDFGLIPSSSVMGKIIWY